jgi:hypothetical protein
VLAIRRECAGSCLEGPIRLREAEDRSLLFVALVMIFGCGVVL